jgi:hypothetical protein
MDQGRDATAVALEGIEREIKDIRRAFKGDEFSGQPGVLSRLEGVERDIEAIKLAHQKEVSEREGMKKLLQWVGATSVTGVIATLAMIVTLITTLSGGGA